MCKRDTCEQGVSCVQGGITLVLKGGELGIELPSLGEIKMGLVPTSSQSLLITNVNDR